MKKKVASVIASARALIRTPSTQDLPDEVLRLLVHRAVEKYTVFAINEKPDFLTNDSLIDLTYDDSALGYEFDLDIKDTMHDIHIVKMFCQPVGDDPDADSWCEVTFVKYRNFPHASRENKVVACMFGNEWDKLSGRRLRFNRTQDWVAQYRFRIGFRVVLGEALKYDDYVPFPHEHITLIEDAVAEEAIGKVSDNTADWKSFVAMESQKLNMKVQEGLLMFSKWLLDDIDSLTVVTARPYNYRFRNQLKGGRFRRYRLE